MSTEKAYKSLKEFYPYYLTEHQDSICRNLHFVGTGIVIALFVTMLLTQIWWLFFLIPLAGYGFAWMGHFVFEKNKPATFQYPSYSLASDFIMFYHILTGQIGQQLKDARKTILGKE